MRSTQIRVPSRLLPRLVWALTALLIAVVPPVDLPATDRQSSALQNRPAQSQESAPPGLPMGFTDDIVDVNGTSLHYVRGGQGPLVVLIHGYPQDWYEWHKIMPRLANNFTTLAVDLRGIGRSRPTATGYDAANLAEDIFQLLRTLRLNAPYIIGHDIGGMVTYAYARLHPDSPRGVMILDVGLPGIEPWEEAERLPKLWHFHFHQIPKLPETLVQGHQFEYFREFFSRFTLDPGAIPDADVNRYATAYSTDASLRAGFEFYRAFPANVRFNQSRRNRLNVPLTLAGGEHSAASRNVVLAKTLRSLGVANVATEVIAASGHYVAEERPESVASLIERYARPPTGKGR